MLENNIKVYNSLTNKMEDFKPIKKDEISMYVCGPTVYNHMHIGNARPVVFFDTVRRFFEYIGYQVKMVSNQSYTPWCMNVRNHYMVDHSDRVLAVWDGSSGGTKNCIDYAKEKMVPVDFILPKPYPTRKEEN